MIEKIHAIMVFNFLLLSLFFVFIVCLAEEGRCLVFRQIFIEKLLVGFLERALIRFLSSLYGALGTGRWLQLLELGKHFIVVCTPQSLD